MELFRENAAELAVTTSVLRYCCPERIFVEVGPAGRGRVVFRVGGLPYQEVTQAHLARCANYQVGVRDVARVEVARDSLFGDVVRFRA